MEKQGNYLICDTRLYQGVIKTQLYPEGHLDARRLYATPGTRIPLQAIEDFPDFDFGFDPEEKVEKVPKWHLKNHPSVYLEKSPDGPNAELAKECMDYAEANPDSHLAAHLEELAPEGEGEGEEE